MDPLGNIVSYRNKSAGLMFLDLDDLGHTTDTVVYPNGTAKVIKMNREIVTLRGTISGQYTVNVFFYGRHGEQTPAKAKVTLTRINPKFEVVLTNEISIEQSGNEKTAFSFTLNEDRDVTDKNELPKPFVVKTYQEVRP
jgi:hypothetical protein